MPLLNPGIVVNSPFLADAFIATRQAQTIDAKGRVTVAHEHLPAAFGIVTSAKQSDLNRLPDLQNSQNVISVITRCELRGPTPGAQPDIITWRGTSFLVKVIDAYPQFGQGWYKALAASQNAIDLMPENCNGE